MGKDSKPGEPMLTVSYEDYLRLRSFARIVWEELKRRGDDVMLFANYKAMAESLGLEDGR